VLGWSGECSNQNPQGGGFFFEIEQEREGGEGFLRFGKERGDNRLNFSRPGTHRRAARADSPRRPCGRSTRCADGPAPRRGRSVIRSRTSSAAPLPHEPRRQSAPSWRTVRQERPDSPVHCRGQSDFSFSS
jgi:hypothetical protein